MARSSLISTSVDLNNDSGSVLLSLVQGEQLELPVTLNFLTIANESYTYKAVLLEANNQSEDGLVPTNVNPVGVKEAIPVRIPPYKGLWYSTTQYVRNDIVAYGALYYILTTVSSPVGTNPSTSVDWQVCLPNIVYLQFSKTLSTNYTIQPTPTDIIYGYLELSIAEPDTGTYQRIWKPLRGLVSFAYSPVLQVS
jgi:hypothetical protein